MQRNRTGGVRPRSARAGMTLIEVIIAMVIFAGALLAMGAFTSRFTQAVSQQRIKSTASQLAADRLEVVKSATSYGTIDSLYKGTEATVPGFPGYTRATAVTRVGGGPSDLQDYMIVTVTVTNRGLRDPVRRTTVVGSF